MPQRQKWLFFFGIVGMLLVVPQDGYAQLPLDFGIKGGVNFADIRTEAVGGGERRSGLAAGAFVAFDTPGPLVLQAEMLYMQKGDEDKVGTGAEQVTGTLKLDYLEIPLLVKLRGDLLGNARAEIFVGPAFAFKVREDFKLSGNTEGITFVDEEDNAMGTDFGVVFGVGFGIEGPPGTLLFDLRFTPGIGEIAEIGKGGPSEFELRPDASNSVFSVMIGLEF